MWVSECRTQPVVLGLSTVLFLFPLLILLYKGSYNLTAGLLLLGSLTYCGFHRRTLRIERDDWLLFAALLTYPLVLLVSVLLQGGKWSALDYPWRVLAVFPIVLCLKTIPAQKCLSNSWSLGWLWGSLFAGAMAVYLVFWQGWLRVGSQITNEIPYGQIAAVMALGCFLFFCERLSAWQELGFLIAGFCALFALASSGTRGAWLGFVVAALCCAIFAIHWSWRRILAALIVLMMAISYLQTLPQVHSRLDLVKSELRSYQLGDSYTSVGVRLDLWLQSYALAQRQPFLGVGPGNFKTALAPEIAAKPYLSQFAHAHSQYFDTLANAGFAGLTALLVSFLVPLYLFWRKVLRLTGWSRAYALQGCGLIICSMVVCLNQPLYAHNISVIFYLICLSVYWSLSGSVDSKQCAPVCLDDHQ
jgi:O-antigen ligase